MTRRATAALGFRPRLPRAVAPLLHGAAVVVVTCAVLAICGGGCFGRERPNLYSDDAALKIPAIKSLARQGHMDLRTAAELVKDLDSDDPAVRFYTIGALHRLTGGDTFGYRFYDDEIERKPALKRWQSWLAQLRGEPTPSTAPASVTNDQ